MMAAIPAIGGTMPRSCEVTFKGPTSTSLRLLVYGIPRIARTTIPATMRSTPIQPSGRMITPRIGVTYGAAGGVPLQDAELLNFRSQCVGGFMQRRSFLKGAGAVTVVVAGGGIWRANDQGVFSIGKGPAYEPWHDWRGSGKDGPSG